MYLCMYVCCFIGTKVEWLVWIFLFIRKKYMYEKCIIITIVVFQVIFHRCTCILFRRGCV